VKRHSVTAKAETGGDDIATRGETPFYPIQDIPEATKKLKIEAGEAK